jgi:hypothetical protein
LLGGIGEGEELAQDRATPSGERHESAGELHGAFGVAGDEGGAAYALFGVGELDWVDVAGDDLMAAAREDLGSVAGGGDAEDARFTGEGCALDLVVFVHLAEEQALRTVS